MDLLFSRYASPFSLVDCMISTKRFSEFVVEFVKLDGEHQLWDFYLHKIIDKTFKEFKEGVESDLDALNTSDSKVIDTVSQSKNILNNFTP